jgi:outer membrane receptor protein involved in Fe transport
MLQGLQLLGALEATRNDGPWDQPERPAQDSMPCCACRSGSSAQRLRADGPGLPLAHGRATEHVPERAITNGEIGRFGALSSNDGGITHRYSLSGEWERSDAAGAGKVSAFVADYGLNLFSAPSGFMNGPQGDQHEQEDQRITWGGQASRSWFLGPEWHETELALGLQMRRDRVGTVGLYDTVDRVRTSTVRQDRMTETASGLFVQARSQWTPWLRSTAGLRYDRIHADVVATGGPFNLANGGAVSAGQASPKFGLVLGPFGPHAKTELYANWGYGYHSNDVRGATSVVNPADGSATEQLSLFAKAKGAEAGLRTTVLPGWSSSLSLWRMELGSELVFIGDEGVTEAKGASTRHGVEWSNYYAPNSWLIVDGDIAWSKARFKVAADNGGSEIPNAIPLTASLGIGADPGGQWFGGLRMRYLGAYALEETGEQKSRSLFTANLKVGYRIAPKVQLSVDILNLFDREANDIEYWGGACTRSEQTSGACGGGIDGRLIHPLEPRTMRVTLRAAF